MRRTGPTATLLEWDDHIPSFDEVHAEARKAEQHIPVPRWRRHESAGTAAAHGRGGDGAAARRPTHTRNRPGDAEFVKPNDRLTALERLEIYNRQYWFRVLDSLDEDFPGLRAIVGRRAFDRLSRAYMAECPSQSFTLRNLGSRLEEWLARHPAICRPALRSRAGYGAAGMGAH